MNRPRDRIVCAGTLLAAVFSIAAGAADFAQVRDAWQPSYAYLLDRDGVVLEADRVAYRALRTEWFALGDVSPALREAVIRIEDHRFRQHHGVDWRAL